MSTEFIDKDKWLQARKLADTVYDKPSAYKSGYIVKKYKELNGRFKTVDKPRNKTKSRSRSRSRSRSLNKSGSTSKPKTRGLSRWFAEKWVNQRGIVGYQHKSDVYRPTYRITAKTPVTWSELTKKEIDKARKVKATGQRVKRFRKV
jgi:hypothetical protein